MFIEYKEGQKLICMKNTMCKKTVCLEPIKGGGYIHISQYNEIKTPGVLKVGSSIYISHINDNGDLYLKDEENTYFVNFDYMINFLIDEN